MRWVCLWFLGDCFLSVSKFDGENKNMSLTWTEKNILKAFYALKYCFCRKKLCCEKHLHCATKRKKNILTQKKNIVPSPFKLNGCSLGLLSFYKPCTGYINNFTCFILERTTQGTEYVSCHITLNKLLNILTFFNTLF